MSAAELDTVRRLGLPMVVVVYNDDAYGAEVHHFGPDGATCRRCASRPPTSPRSAAASASMPSASRRVDDLAAVQTWLDGAARRPLLIDAKVTADRASWWLEEAFRGH